MIVSLLQLRLRLGESRSLKDKRRELRSIKDRIRHRFNVSICETGDHELLNAATIAVVKVDLTRRDAEAVFNRIVDQINGNGSVEILECSMEVR